MKESGALQWLKHHSFRVTQARLAIVRELLKARSPLTLAELHQRIGQGDFATVFRFLGSAEKQRLVRTHTWRDRQLRYELVQDGSHHHHLVCKGCGRVEEIDTCAVGTLQAELERQRGYVDLSHSLEFFGVCPRCQKKQSPPRRQSQVPSC